MAHTIAFLQHATLAAIVESSFDAIITKTLDGVIRTWNDGAQRIFDFSADEVVGQSITMIIPEDRQAEALALLERLKGGEQVCHLETVRRTKSGKQIDVALTISPIMDKAGQIIGACKLVKDITESKRASELLQQRGAEIERLSHLKTSNKMVGAAHTLDDENRAKIRDTKPLLSDRERQILTLLSKGLSSKQIAVKLGISIHTVANHRAHLRKKTGAANTAEMVRIALLTETGNP